MSENDVKPDNVPMSKETSYRGIQGAGDVPPALLAEMENAQKTNTKQPGNNVNKEKLRVEFPDERARKAGLGA